jgi:hypothetical protein
MTQLKFVDAISLENARKAGPADGTAFYLPGGNAFRAWPHSEVAGITTRYRLPVFVRSNPTLARLPGDIEVTLTGLTACGAPRGSLIALDSETSVDPTYVRGFFTGVHKAGYRLIDYGSQSVVFGNLNPEGYYWGADWTDAAHIHSGDDATQFVSFANYDVSEFSSALPLWDTRPPTPPDTQGWIGTVKTGAIMSNLPVVTLGMSDKKLPHLYVGGRIQPILNATWHMGLATDGVYGPRTQAAVKKLQQQYRLPASEEGMVGPATWALILTGAH